MAGFSLLERNSKLYSKESNAKVLSLFLAGALMFVFLSSFVSAIFVGNGTVHSDGCYNYTANQDFNVTSLNYSSCNFQIDGAPYCEWGNRSFFDTNRVCFDEVNVTDEDGGLINSINVSGDESDSGTLFRGSNATFNVTLFNQTSVDSVWVNIWESVIGGVVKFFGFLTNFGNNVWSIDAPINSSFNESEYNYTVYANTTGGVESNVSGSFSVSDIGLDSVVLNSSTGTNTTAENLTAYLINLTPSSASVIYDWRLNQSSIAVVNLPFNSNESNSTFSSDHSTFLNNATPNNSAFNSIGGLNQTGGYVFDGTSSFMTVPYDSSLKVQKFTVTSWVKPSSLHTLQWVMGYPYNCTAHVEGSNGVGFMQYGIWITQAGEIHTRINGTFFGNYGAGNITANNWHHLAITYDSETARFYIDGELIHSDTRFSGPISYPGDCNFMIGKNVGNAEYFNGTIDNLQIYNRSLSTGQVQKLYSMESVILKEELSPGDVWQIKSTPVYRNETGNSVLSNNLTVLAELNNPNVAIINPSSATNLTSKNFSIEISANVTDESFFTVFANLTLPNGSVNQLSLKQSSGDLYSINYTFPDILGKYNITFVATDNSGNVNSSETTFFNYGPSIDSVSINGVDVEAVNSENLTANISNFNSPGSAGKVIYDWKLNGDSIAVVNMPMDSFSSFSDNFDDNLIDSNWVVNANSGTINETDSKLNLSCSSCDFWRETQNSPFALLEIPPVENFTATVKLENYSVPGGTHTGMILYDDPDNFYLWGAYADSGSSLSYKVEGVVADVGIGDASVVSESTLPVWFRIRKVGDIKFYDYSTNGINFTSIYNSSDFAPRYVGAFAKSWLGNGIDVSFDNFSLTSEVLDYSDSNHHGNLGNESNYSFDSIPKYNSIGGYDGKGAYEFDGDDYIDLGNWNISGEQLTITGWAYIENENRSQVIIGQSANSTHSNPYYSWVAYFLSPNQALQCRIGDKATISENSTFSINQWVHFACVYNGTHIFSYQNGALSNNTETQTGNVLGSTQNVRIGSRHTTDNPFDESLYGKVSEVQVFERVLSGEQISALYNNRTDLIVSSETNIGENWSVSATPHDDYSFGQTLFSGNISVEGTLIGSVFLNSTPDNLNGSWENLTAYPINVSPSDAKLIYDWRENSTSIAVLNMPFETNATCGVGSNLTCDYSGYSNNGTVNGSNWNAAGGYDGKGAYEFDGVDDIINLPSTTLTSDLSTADVTVEAWVYPTEYASSDSWHLIDMFLFGRRNGQDLVFGVGAGGSMHGGWWEDGIAAAPDGTIQLNNWTHVALVYSDDENITKLYANGVEVANVTETRTIDHATYSCLTIGDGCGGQGEAFAGRISEMRIYKRALSVEQISALANNRTDLIVSEETSFGENWSVMATPVYDGVGGDSVLSNNLTIVSPSIDSVILNSTSQTNLTVENLTAYPINVSPSDSKFVYDWRLNGSSIAVLNMPFETIATCGIGSNLICDFSGYANNGSLGNATSGTKPTWNLTGGYDGKGAYEFDGSNDFIEIADDSSLDIVEELTISSWVYLKSMSDVNDEEVIVAKRFNETSNYHLGLGEYQLSDSKLGFHFNNGTEIVSFFTDGNISLNQWNFLAATYNNATSTVNLYVNGILNKSFTNATGGLSTNDAQLQIGRGSNDTFSFFHFNGTIDEVRIFNQSLSSDQISALYNNRTDLIVSKEITGGDNWSVSATPFYLGEKGTSVLSNNLIVDAFSIDSVILNSTSLGNTTSENLTAYAVNISVNDSRVIYDWRKNSSSIAVVNMPMDGGALVSLGRVKDYSSNSRHGTLGSGTAGTEPVYNSTGGYDGRGAYHFNGINQSIDLGNWNISTNKITISAWVKKDSNVSSIIIGQSASPTQVDPFYAWNLYTSATGRLHIRLNDTIIETQNGFLTTDKWYHVVGVYDGEFMKLFSDGSLIEFRKVSLTIPSSTQKVIIGGRDTPNTGNLEYFNGTIDEVLVYDIALSDSQVSSLYNNRTDLILKDMLSLNETWEVSATPNENTQDGTSILSNNLTVLSETNVPLVSDVSPVLGENFSSTEATVRISANVTDDSGFSVDANVTLPNGTVSQIDLLSEFGNTFSSNFTTSSLVGRYNVTFIATDNSGNVNSSETTFFNYGSEIDSLVMNSSALGNTTSENLTAYVSTNNLGNGTVTYDWRKNNESIALLNMPFDEETGFVDDFSDGIFEEHWILDSGKGNIVEENGILNFSCSSVCGWTRSVFDSPYVYVTTDSFGNFSATVKVQDHNFTDNSFGGLALFDDEENVFLWGKHLFGSTDYYRIEMIIDNQGSVVDQINISTLPAWFRIRQEVNTTYFEYSTDGVNFTLFRILYAGVNFTGDFNGRFVGAFGVNWNTSSFSVPIESFEVQSFSVKDYSSFDNSGDVGNALGVFGDSTTMPFYNSSGGYNGRGAYEFDGSNDFINTSVLLNQSGSNSYTLSAWVKPKDNSSVSGHIISSDNGGFDWSLVYENSSWKVFNGSSSFDTGASVDNNTWQHLAVSFDVSSNKSLFYKNGVLISNTTIDFDSNSGNIYLGRSSSGDFFNGTIDEVLVFNRSLSHEQISAIYNNRTDLIVSNEISSNDVWKVRATPNDGGIDGTSVLSNNITILDTTLPLVFDLNPVNGTNFNVSDTIEISANVTDDFLVDTVLANVVYPNNTVEQLILSNFSQKYNSSFTIPALLGQYSVTFVANDTSNNTNSSEITFFVGVDNEPPSLVNVSCSPNPGPINSTVTCNATVTDNLEVSFVSVNLTMINGTVINPTISNSSDVYNFTFDETSETGFYNLTWIANDSLNNLATFDTNFEITQPVITVLGCSPNPANLSQDVVCESNVTTGTSAPVNTVLANVTLPNGTVLVQNVLNVSTVYNFTFSSTSDLIGTYNVSWFANDSVGSFTTQSENFTVNDVTPPLVFDLRPVSNSTHNVSDTIEISANFTDNIETDIIFANVTLPNGTIEKIILNNSIGSKYNNSFTLPNIIGQYNVTFIANDTSNNLNSTETTFFVGNDVTPPLVFDLIPTSGTNFNVSDVIEIGANITDDVSVNVVLANVTLPNGTVQEITLSNSQDNKYNSSFTIPNVIGTYNVTFIANDTSNNINSTETTFFVGEDFVAPSVFGLIPTSGTSFNDSSAIEISANVTDAVGVSVVSANVTLPNGTVQEITLNNTQDNKYNSSFTLSNGTGTYNVTFIANDTSNNINSSETTSFVAVEAFGVVGLNEIFFLNESTFNYSNVFNSSNITYDMNVTYIGANCTASEGRVSNVTFSLFNSEDNVNYVNETGYSFIQNDLYVWNSSYQIRDSGNWTLNVSCYASGNGTTRQNSTSWEIPWGTIAINLISPSVDSDVQFYEFFTFSSNVTCSGGECGIINVTLDPQEVLSEDCREVKVCEELKIGTNCVNETVSNCNEECGVESTLECLEETKEVCEDVTNTVCSDVETCNDECLVDPSTGEEVCSEVCLTEEICEDITTQECSTIVSEVCNEVQNEVCAPVNCTESFVESCEDIFETKCATEVVCDGLSNETQIIEVNESVEDVIDSEINQSQGILNETQDDLNETEEIMEGNFTEEENLIDEILNETQIKEENKTIIEENKTVNIAGEEFDEGEILEDKEGKDLGEKIEDEIDYETYFLEMNQSDLEFRVVFYHDYNGSLPVYVLGDVNYSLDKNESEYLENVSLTVELINGILPQFELHVGHESEVFSFGKVIPKVELKEGNYSLIDRDDLKLDVHVHFDSNESIVLRGLKNETNVSVTLGFNSLEDVSSSIIAVPTLNVENATIVLEKTGEVNSIVLCDDENFNYETLECSNWEYAHVDFIDNNGTIEFNVKHFTAYAGGNLTAGETASLTIWDYNDVGMRNASLNTTTVKIVNETIEFFADYKLAQNGTKISSGNCSINFSDSVLVNMNYNSSYEAFFYERNFTSNGIYTYDVNCSHSIYTDLNSSDSIIIGENSNSTKSGAVSTVIGDVPFYTTDDNPKTCDIKGGETCNISWQVNSTGVLNKDYTFFVEAIGSYVSYTNSSHIDLTITANDTNSPEFISTSVSPAAVINGSDVIINANLKDNIQVDSFWLNISLPDNSSEFISSASFPYVFSNTNQTGIYTVNYYANDSSGNNATATRSFEVGVLENLTMNVSVEVGIGVNTSSDVDLFVYTRGTSDEVAIREDINGTESILLPNVLLDLFFNTTFGNDSRSVTLNNVNLSLSNEGEINFSDSDVSGYLTVYVVNTSFVFDNATVEISYSNLGYSNEDNLQLHKCDDFDIENQVCLSGFNDVTSSATHDKDGDRFTYLTTSFSGFGIIEVTPTDVTGDSTGGSTGGSGGGGGGSCTYNKNYDWECSEWSSCADGVQVRTCNEFNNCGGVFGKPSLEQNCSLIPEQLFDITWNLEDLIIRDSSKLEGVVTFESFGFVPTLVNLTFIIIDGEGTELYREETNINVTTEEIVRWKFAEQNLSELPEGNYVAILETLYGDLVYDEFRQEFKVAEKSNFVLDLFYSIRDYAYFDFIIFSLFVFLILFIVWFFNRRKNRIKK